MSRKKIIQIPYKFIHVHVTKEKEGRLWELRKDFTRTETGFEPKGSKGSK
jgi:hypothetical protein